MAKGFVLVVELLVVLIHEIFLMLIAWIVTRIEKKEVEAACLGEFNTGKTLGTHYPLLLLPHFS